MGGYDKYRALEGKSPEEQKRAFAADYEEEMKKERRRKGEIVEESDGEYDYYSDEEFSVYESYILSYFFIP